MQSSQPARWDLVRIEKELIRPEELAKILPDGQKPERFAIMILDYLRDKPKLVEAIANDGGISFMNSLHQVAELGLSLNEALGEVALVPSKGQVKIRPMFRGLRKLACQSPGVLDIWARVVYDNDILFDWQEGTDAWIRHKPNQADEPMNMTHAYAVVKFADGRTRFEIMGREEILKCRNASEAWKFKPGTGPWATHEGEMAKKTAIRRLTKSLNLENEKLLMAEKLDNDDYDWNGTGKPMRTLSLRPPAPARRVLENPEEPPPKAVETLPYCNPMGEPDHFREPENPLEAKIAADSDKILAKWDAEAEKKAVKEQPQPVTTKTFREAVEAAKEPEKEAKTEDELRGLLRGYVMDLAQGDQADAKRRLKFLAGFVNEEGQSVEGFETVRDERCAGKWLRVTYGKAKKAYEESLGREPGAKGWLKAGAGAGAEMQNMEDLRKP